MHAAAAAQMALLSSAMSCHVWRSSVLVTRAVTRGSSVLVTRAVTRGSSVLVTRAVTRAVGH